MCLDEGVGNVLRTQVSLYLRNVERPMYNPCDCLLQWNSLELLSAPRHSTQRALYFETDLKIDSCSKENFEGCGGYYA